MLEKLIKQQDSLYQLKNGLLKHHRRNMKETQAFERAVKMLQKHIGKVGNAWVVTYHHELPDACLRFTNCL